MGLNKAQRQIKDAKRDAVVARIQEIAPRVDALASIWDEQTLDILILILGIGRVELDA